jgi:hypothetical protein
VSAEDSKAFLVDVRPEEQREEEGTAQLKLGARFRVAAFPRQVGGCGVLGGGGGEDALAGGVCTPLQVGVGLHCGAGWGEEGQAWGNAACTPTPAWVWVGVSEGLPASTECPQRAGGGSSAACEQAWGVSYTPPSPQHCVPTPHAYAVHHPHTFHTPCRRRCRHAWLAWWPTRRS